MDEYAVPREREATVTKTGVRFLGTSSCIPEPGSDTVSFVVNGRMLVDTGWLSVHNLRSNGIDPGSIEHLVITHFHHDHYMSLPALLYYRISNKLPPEGLTILGPTEDLRTYVTKALEFLNKDPLIHMPGLVPLGDLAVYEAPGFELRCVTAPHTVPALSFRFTDRSTGKVVSWTGDAAPNPGLAERVLGSDLLIAECAYGPGRADPADNGSLHSGAEDAGLLAAQAGVKRLALVHSYPRFRERSSASAAKHFTGDLIWPQDGQILEL